MDPDATLRDLVSAVGDRNWDRVAELQEALLAWMERRGFPPLTIGPKKLGRAWHRAVATFVCHAAASKVQDARKRQTRRREA
jgi:hypothetical protein